MKRSWRVTALATVALSLFLSFCPQTARADAPATAAPTPAPPAPSVIPIAPAEAAPPAPPEIIEPPAPPVPAAAPPPPSGAAPTAPAPAPAATIAADALPPAAIIADSPPTAPRPKIEMAIGMGASLDESGLVSGLSAVPAFFAMGGFGDGLFGADFGAFVNSATGRYRAPNIPVDRLDFDGMWVVRPAARLRAGEPGYGLRILHDLGLELGLGYERASHVTGAGAEEVNRLGLRVGGRIDIPLTPLGDPGASTSELRLRLAARRLFGFSKSAFSDGTPIADTRAELFAALAVVF